MRRCATRIGAVFTAKKCASSTNPTRTRRRLLRGSQKQTVAIQLIRLDPRGDGVWLITDETREVATDDARRRRACQFPRVFRGIETPVSVTTLGVEPLDP